MDLEGVMNQDSILLRNWYHQPTPLLYCIIFFLLNLWIRVQQVKYLLRRTGGCRLRYCIVSQSTPWIRQVQGYLLQQQQYLESFLFIINTCPQQLKFE